MLYKMTKNAPVPKYTWHKNPIFVICVITPPWQLPPPRCLGGNVPVVVSQEEDEDWPNYGDKDEEKDRNNNKEQDYVLITDKEVNNSFPLTSVLPLFTILSQFMQNIQTWVLPSFLLAFQF